MAAIAAPRAQSILTFDPYPGRGIIVGVTEDGKHAIAVYFLTGRSENSRNRILVLRNGSVQTEPYDAGKVTDPRLIIYTAMRKYKGRLIVSNGDHTDTVYNTLKTGASFEEALFSRTYEPDAPHYTPRIAALLDVRNGCAVNMAILRRQADGRCRRDFFSYPAEPGVGHYLSTYSGSGDPLPSFAGDPLEVTLEGTPANLARSLWDSLDGDNRIALAVKAADLSSGRITTTIINKHTEKESEGEDGR